MKLFNKSIFEIIYNIKHYSINDSLKDIQKIKDLSDEEFKNWQYKTKNNILKYHFENNNLYKRYIGNLSKDWDYIKVVEKELLQYDIHKLISKPYNVEKLYKNKTSGSSGKPFVFTKDYYTQSRVWAARKCFLVENGLDISSKQAIFYRSAKSFKARIIERLKDTILNRVRFDSTNSTKEHFENSIHKFKNIKFEYLYGYTSAIVLFCRYLIDKNILLKDISPSIKLVVVTAETCSNEDKEVIEKATGVKVKNEYGSADLGMIAFECDYGHFHLVEENLYVETNEQSELIVTDLYNKSFPFVKYKLGDVAKISNEKCHCGNRNRFIYDFMGRSNDIVKLKKGNEVLGYSFYQIVRPILEETNLLKEFFIKQTGLDKFEFEIVALDKFSKETEKKLLKKTNEYLKQKNTIKINYSEIIERPKTGKLKHFYSEIQKEEKKLKGMDE